ncbi:UNVERIFIED_CONTAM: hypothetical protein Scaly_0973700 [Sesamum calycinum]|uniref:Uncharacterized protein n=2 Tax=Sesamum TaxID=4181 RepID=A0AAW2QYP1_9LAMI
MMEGDRDALYFHTKISERFHTNWIEKLRDRNQEWIRDEVDTQNLIMEHFEEVFKGDSLSNTDIDLKLKELTAKIDKEMNQMLKPYSAEKVTRALFQMTPLKFPEPDGMLSIFFQNY